MGRPCGSFLGLSGSQFLSLNTCGNSAILSFVKRYPRCRDVATIRPSEGAFGGLVGGATSVGDFGTVGTYVASDYGAIGFGVLNNEGSILNSKGGAMSTMSISSLRCSPACVGVSVRNRRMGKVGNTGGAVLGRGPGVLVSTCRHASSLVAVPGTIFSVQGSCGLCVHRFSCLPT